ncbi:MULTISPECIES: hypothetical protein [Chryseobacterium]|uniref:Uncharacterized protein n=1 Tax=Chryseobacterium taihuense TaxID=1141221 RepID=A0A4U8WCX6_9FLAO|nr:MULTISPECIES: hypothetical protein [Chryseobacterium]QQV02751.1 hypothetical protein I6I61_17075 [Chryseobacterium sp. FDAARGOS 1104]VFB03983.1 Uncharacterised protein [Chryseobacterium taihuense]
MAENEELNFDFDPDNIPDTNTFWNGLDAYWHANRQFPQGTDQKLSKKADLIDGKIPSSQLPSYVDDVLEFNSFGDLPNPGEQGKIYVTTDKNSILRWNGTEYIQLNSEIDGEIVVQSVPNSMGTVLTYNPTTKKVSTRTNAEIISDMSLMTTNTVQHATNRKFFDTYGTDWGDNSLLVYAIAPLNPAMTFYKEGESVGQIQYNLFNFNFINHDGSGYNSITASAFKKAGYNDGFILLAGGGHVPISEFVINSDLTNQLTNYHKRDIGAGNNSSDIRTNQTWFDYNWAGTGELGSVINYSGLGGQYSTEVFGSYNNPDKVAIRTRQGDINAWNEPRWLWHDKNFNPATKADVSQLANYLPLSGGTLSGGGRIDQFGNIVVQQNNNGGNATGIYWESIDNSQFIGGIGAYTENGIFGNHYLGWGASPSSNSTSLAVGENIFTYKNNQIWHEGNLIPHKQRQTLLTSDTNNIEANSSGALYYNNLANSPYPSSQDIVGSISNFGGKTYGYDLANVRLGGNRLYFRDYYGNNPSAWNEIYHTGNFNPDTKADVSQLLNYWEKKDIAGIYWALDSNRDLGVLNGQQAQRLLTGGLLVSNAYSDAQFIPTNGIYSRGNISTLNYGSAIDWAIAATWTQTQGATMTWVSQNFINQSSLNTQLSNYATLNGVQTFTNTNTFLQSPIIPNATLGNHAVNLNQADGRYVNMLYDQNIGGIKNFTGAYTQWVLNGDSNNAIAFVQSLPGAVALGSLNNNDVGIYRNVALKLNFKENEAEFTDNVKIPNGILASHAVNLSQLNSAIGSHTHTFASLTSKPTTLSGYGITDAIPTSHPVNGVNTTQINSWDSAFSWGNHAVAGYATSDFVDESIAQITAEFINPDYPISTSCKVNTVIITEEFTQEYVTLEDELFPERQITITNLSPNNIGVIREDKKIDTISPGETTEYYITSEKRLVKKGTYKGAVFLS